MFPFLLAFFHQLILRVGIFGAVYPYSLAEFIINALQQLLFQQTYSLFLWGLLITQTCYQKMGKGCKETLRQNKELHNSYKLRKAVAA